MERWRDRVALVTGASVGIGAQVCRQLAQHGMKVVACARNVQKIQDLASEFPSGTILPLRCDLEKEEDILSVFEEIRSRFKRIDVCINNAGFSSNSNLLTAKTEEWRAMLNVNVLALCICTRETIKLMQEKGIDDGQIIHISSIAGHKVFRMASFYSGTKFMVQALTEGLRQEMRALKNHIRVTSISPGIVKTEFVRRWMKDDSKADAFYSQIECLTPEDIAAAVITILRTPAHVDMNEIVIRPVEMLE